MPALAHTSVPRWALPDELPGGPIAPGPDTRGASYLLVGVGEPASAVVRLWATDLAGLPDVRIVEAREVGAARARLEAALAEARVGVRLWLAGPAGACLALRGTATRAGVEDDELYVAPTSAGPIELFCAHCAAVTVTEAGIGDVVPCAACQRSLLVYHHVSRRSGRFLGYMVDAEEAGR